MFVKPLFMLFLLMAAVSPLDAASSCAPSCQGAVEEGDKVQIPWDCTQYAVCGDLHGNGELWPSDPTSCPDDQYFNVDLSPKACSPIAGADLGFCNNYCSPCVLFWNFTGDLTPDPNDCGTYYATLSGGTFVALHCVDDDPNKPYYDYLRGTCSSDPRVCYNFCESCQVYCVGETYIADPEHCSGFYYCSPPEITHFNCPADEYFDQELKICSADAPCSTCL